MFLPMYDRGFFSTHEYKIIVSTTSHKNILFLWDRWDSQMILLKKVIKYFVGIGKLEVRSSLRQFV